MRPLWQAAELVVFGSYQTGLYLPESDVDLVCIALSVVAYLLETTMNAALAIFGIGVGVGLVLGDSFRAALPLLPAVQQQ